MTAYYNEFDPKAAAWLRELIRCGLIADGVVDERSILEVKPEDLRGFTQCHFFAGIGGWSYALRLAGWPDDRPVWTGSPPCQPFSSAGQQKGQKDERHLAPHFAALVAECRPSILFGEQVASAAVFGKATSGARKAPAGSAAPEWAWLDDLFERLEAAHYACGASDIPSAGIGAPNIRQRTFFGAVRLGRMGDSEDICADWGESGSMGSTQRAVQSQTRQGYGKTAGVAGGDERLADTSEFGQSGSWFMGRSSDTAQGSNREIHRTVDAGGRERLADANGRQCQRLTDGEGRFVNGAATRRLESDSEFERGSTSGGPQWSNATDSPRGTADWLFCRDGKWRPVESSLLSLADGVPAELVRSGAFVPASFPLAPAARDSRRVMRLRGYGNAISPWAAKVFIGAFDAANNECFRLIETIDEGVFG